MRKKGRERKKNKGERKTSCFADVWRRLVKEEKQTKDWESNAILISSFAVHNKHGSKGEGLSKLAWSDPIQNYLRRGLRRGCDDEKFGFCKRKFVMMSRPIWHSRISYHCLAYSWAVCWCILFDWDTPTSVVSGNSGRELPEKGSN